MPRDVTSRIVRNSFNLLRAENGVARDIVAIFDRAALDMEAIVLRRDPTAVLPRNRRRRVRALDRELGAALDQAFKEARALGLGSTVTVAQIQEGFALGVLETATTGVDVAIGAKRQSAAFWRRLILDTEIEGGLFDDWLKTQNANAAAATQRQIQLGLSQGEPVESIVRRVRGRKVGNRLVGGTVNIARDQVVTLVRTAINQISNDAHFETYSQHPNVTEEFRYVATLDSRTSDICIGLDGKTFRYDDPAAKRPPQHFRCRSTIVPEIKWRDLGLTPPSEGTRASEGGPIRASTDYAEWLRGQDAATIDEVLGPARGKLFRSGKLDVRRLARSDGSSFTLDELKRRTEGM